MSAIGANEMDFEASKEFECGRGGTITTKVFKKTLYEHCGIQN